MVVLNEYGQIIDKFAIIVVPWKQFTSVKFI